MKSYNHLWEKLITDENIENSIKTAVKGKKNRNNIKKYLQDETLPQKLKNYTEHYHNAKHTPKEIYDGIVKKKRTIIVPTFYELTVQHMIVHVLEPIFMHGMYEHSYGSVPNRGAHKGKKTIEKWFSKGDCKYCLKMDIKKYFDSIPHNILIQKLTDLIHDEKMLKLLIEIISVSNKGIPLGFYLSQWLANWYLQDLDHYIKENLRADYYIRYMDDMVILSDDKEKLYKIRIAISNYLKNNLGLELKNNYQVFNLMSRPLDFMGFKFYLSHTTLRKSIMLRITRKALRISKYKKPRIFEIRQFLSYLGWLKPTSTYSMYLNWIRPYISIQNFKRRISKYDLRLIQKEVS